MIGRFLVISGFSKLAEKQFLKLAYQKLEDLTEAVQMIDDEEIDVSASDAILTIRRRNQTIVINTQTPNRQLWYSSPVSGPQRFDWKDEKWLNIRDEEIEKVVETDMRAILTV